MSNNQSNTITTEKLSVILFPGDLRDYFAAHALTGLIAATSGMHKSSGIDISGPKLCQAAYDAADGMIEERSTRQQPTERTSNHE